MLSSQPALKLCALPETQGASPRLRSSRWSPFELLHSSRYAELPSVFIAQKSQNAALNQVQSENPTDLPSYEMRPDGLMINGFCRPPAGRAEALEAMPAPR